jgi:hypothetical protein
MVVKDQATVVYMLDDVLVFDVEESVEGRGAWYGKLLGAVRPNLKWETEFLSDSEVPAST